MNSTVKSLLFAVGGVILYEAFFYIKRNFACDEEAFLESHHFEDALEKADDLCEIGYTFQKNEIIYKKISEKGWFVEISFPDECPFDLGHEFMIENYIYKKIGEKAWTIERMD